MSKDKAFQCPHPGCISSFYEKKNLRRHENQKHGRIPSKKRSYVGMGMFMVPTQGVEGASSATGEDSTVGDENWMEQQHGVEGVDTEEENSIIWTEQQESKGVEGGENMLNEGAVCSTENWAGAGDSLDAEDNIVLDE